MRMGDRIKAARLRKGLTLEDVAKKVGVARQTMSRYENNIITNIPSDKIEAIAKALEVVPAYLMGWTDDADHYFDGRIAYNFDGSVETKGFLRTAKDGSIPVDITERVAQSPEQTKLAVLFSRSRALTEKQLDIVNSIRTGANVSINLIKSDAVSSNVASVSILLYLPSRCFTVANGYFIELHQGSGHHAAVNNGKEDIC